MNCLRSFYISKMNDINEWIENLKLNDQNQQKIETIFNAKGILLPHCLKYYDKIRTEHIKPLNWDINNSNETMDWSFIETTLMQNGGGFIPDESLSFLLETLFKTIQKQPLSLKLKIKHNYINKNVVKNEISKVIGPNNCGQYITEYFPESINSSLINILKHKNKNIPLLTPFILFLNDIDKNTPTKTNGNASKYMDSDSEIKTNPKTNNDGNISDVTLNGDEYVETKTETPSNHTNNNSNIITPKNNGNNNSDGSDSADFDWDKYEQNNDNDLNVDANEAETKYQLMVSKSPTMANLIKHKQEQQNNDDTPQKRYDSVIIHHTKDTIMSTQSDLDPINLTPPTTRTTKLRTDHPSVLSDIFSDDENSNNKYNKLIENMSKQINEIYEWVNFQKRYDDDDEKEQQNNTSNNNNNNTNHVPSETQVIREIGNLVTNAMEQQSTQQTNVNNNNKPKSFED
mmetsp:Transcript_10074/g.12529  ORF Transcript_10074/g.12529 Transcript_10074/m.12529 type:complete len:458 (-) Transcript_10074:63-1436(-)